MGGSGNGNGNGSKILEILNVRVVGSGEKVLVLSHGFGTEQSAWKQVVPFFQRDHRIVLYDLACAGSVNPDHFDFRRYATLDGFVDDLLAVLAALRVDRCTLVAHSFSAMIGILASIRRPHLFQKLVLIGASPRYWEDRVPHGRKLMRCDWLCAPRYLANVVHTMFLNDKDYYGGFELSDFERVIAAMENNYEAWVRGFAPLAVGADVPAAVREFSRTLFSMRPDISLFVSRIVFTSDLRSVLGFVRTPCCIIQTAKDHSVPALVAAYLKSHLGGRTTVELINVEGHLPHLSEPNVFVQVLRRALASR